MTTLSQRYRPLAQMQPQGAQAMQPTGGAAPIPTGMPGTEGMKPVTPQTPTTGIGQRGPQNIDPTTGDPTFNRPTFNPRPPTPGVGVVGKPITTVEGSGIKPTTRPATPITPAPIVPPPTGRVEPMKPIAPETSPVGGNLRGDVYLPGEDTRLTGAQGRTDAAGMAISGMNRQGMQAGNENRYRSLYGDGQVSGTMDALTGAPDRTALAMQKLKDFDAMSEEQRFKEERALGQNIAKFGRSGMQSNAGDFGEITRKIAGDRGRLANELASSVAEGDINDRFRRVDMETALAERNADRGFQRTNAAVNTATGQTDRGVDDLFGQFDAAGTLEDRIFGQGQSNRGEYRTERSRQDAQAQQTIENRLAEFRIQQELEDAKIRRAAALAQAGGLY